jgi:hypothetical protein
MKVPNESVLWWFLATAALLTLPSCASFGKPVTTLTPRSESVCDQAPPTPLPPIPNTQPEIFAAMREIMGLYRDEITKDHFERDCRAKVREENRAAVK